MEKMQLILQEMLQSFYLQPQEQAMKALNDIFIRPESLYEGFKQNGLKENVVDLKDDEYAEFLSHLMGRQQIVQLKGVEIFQAWVIYSIKAQFGFKVDVRTMLQKLNTMFTQARNPLSKCVEFIAKTEIKGYRQQRQWLTTKEEQIKKFCKKLEESEEFAKFMRLRKQSVNKPPPSKLISKANEKSIIKEEVEEKKKEGNEFERLQLQKEGKLIFCEYQQMKTCENLLELQIQKHIFENFIKIYKNTPNYNVSLCNLFERQLPLKLVPVQQLIKRMQEEKRMSKQIQQNLQKIRTLAENINNLESKFTPECQIVPSYQEMLRFWNVVKESLNILNISFLNYLIRNTEKSIGHIKGKNILFLIGPSGAGKTTIILRLLGYELKYTKVNDLLTLLPVTPLKLEHSELITSPEAKSTTKYIFSAKINPEFINSRRHEGQYEGQDEGQNNKSQQEWFLCDTPGFFDTSGPVVDIANGVGMINAVKSAKSVKPIVVLSANMVGEKFEGIKQLGKIVSDLFLQYRKKEEGGSTAFIFNKFEKDEQFNRIQPGATNILKNLSPNEQSDGKYVRFLHVLAQKLKKKRDILKFDPFKIDIKHFIDELSDDMIEKPEDVFKYSFSTKSLMTLRSYFQNKINIINNLLNINISHAYYHIKQLKQLLEIVPNKDFQTEFDSLIQKISNITKEYFMRFKYILNEELLKNQVSPYQIEQLKQIYDKLTLYSQFNSIPQIECYQKTDLDGLIQSASQNLSYALKGLKFTFSQQIQYKKTLRIIKSFSENFNQGLGVQIRRYLKVKYQSTKADVERLAISNSFKQCKEMQQHYQNICSYYEIIDGQTKKLKRFDQIMNERYMQIKSQAETYLKDNENIDSGMQRSLDISWKTIIELDTCYANLESMQIIYISKARQENFKSQITKYLVNAINFYSSKCQEIVHSKQICHENITKFTKYRDSIHVISSFKRLKQQCDQAFKAISSSINRLLEQELTSLERITDYMARNGQFSSKLSSFDLYLFRIKSFSMLSDDMSLREKLQNIQVDLFTQLEKTIKGNLERVKRMKINIRSNLKFDDVNTLIKRQNEVRYLKSIKNKQSFDKQEINLLYFQEQVRLIEEQCKRQLTLPFIQFNQDFQAYLAQDCILRNSKKHLHELSSFIDYENHLKKMMSSKDYERIIDSQLRQKYHINFSTFMRTMQTQLQRSFDQIEENSQLIYSLNKQNILQLKKKIDLLSFILKNENIENQMKNRQYHAQMSSMYKNFIVILEKNQKRLHQQFYLTKNSKEIQYKLKELHEKCYKMKEFDRQLGQDNNFAQILQLLNSEFSLRQEHAINKLIYIFNESSVNCNLLQEFYANNSTNPEIVHEILDKIRQYDRKFYQEIQASQNFNDKLFQDDNMNFVKIVYKTYNYYKDTRSIAKDKIDDQASNLSLEYFKKIMEQFVDNYIGFYDRLMQLIFKFSFKQGIPQNYQDFFQNLEQLIKKLFPKDYKEIRKKIMQARLQLDLTFQASDEISIASYICKINNALISQIQRDFTKIIKIFKPSSVKYYPYLDEQQKDQYIIILREKFDKLIRQYSSQLEKEGISANEENTQIYQFLKLIPEKQIQAKWKDEIQLKREQYYNKIQKAKLQFDIQLKNKERSFKEMYSIYQKMSQNYKSRLKLKLRDVIVQDFQSLVSSNMPLQEIFKRYYLFCQDYAKEEISRTQFAPIYEESKKFFLQNLHKQLEQIVRTNRNSIIEDKNTQSPDQTIQKNESIIRLYLLSSQSFWIEQDPIDDINRTIEGYIDSLIKIYRNQQLVNKMGDALYYEVEISKLQKSIKTKKVLSELLIKIGQIVNIPGIRKYRSNDTVMNIVKFFERSEEEQLKKPFENLLESMLAHHQEIQRFKLDNILKELQENGDSIKKYQFQMEIFAKKLFFLWKFDLIYDRIDLSRYNSSQKIDIFNCSRLAEEALQNEKDLIIKEMTELCQNSLIHRLSFRFAIFMELYQAIKMKIRSETDPFHFVKPIRQSLLNAFNQSINFRNGQPLIRQTITYLNQQKFSGVSTISQIQKQAQKKILDKYQVEAKISIRKLVIFEKMLSRSYPQQQLKQKILSLIENIKNQSHLMPFVLKQLKENLSILEIKKIAMKYKQFKPIFEAEFYDDTKKQLNVFLKELKDKNRDTRLDIGELQKQYLIYQSCFKQTRNRYQNDASQQTINALSKEIIDKTNKDSKLLTIGRIFGLYSIIRSRQTSQGFTFQPHLAQVIAIILILEDSQKYNGIKSCLLEIQTGQGKSIVLAGLACFLALKGYKVYQLCYSKYLVKRDYQNFKELFFQLQIQEKIQYTVFQDIFKMIVSKGKNQISFQEHLKNQLNRSRGLVEMTVQFFKDIGSQLFKIFSFGQKEKNLLLMDEVDVIFSDDFQGQVYLPTIYFSDGESRRQIRDIFTLIYRQSKSNSLRLERIEQSDEYKRLLEGYSNMENLIKGQIKQMVEVASNRQLIALEQQNIKNRNTEGENSYKEMFAYLSLRQKSQLVNENILRKKLRINLKFGQFSYSELPKWFERIIGLTGTLDCLSSRKKTFLKNDYSIKNMYNIPSVYQKQACQVEKNLKVCVSSTYFYIILVQEVTKYFKDTVSNKRAMMIFFRDKKTLQQFSQRLQKSKRNFNLVYLDEKPSDYNFQQINDRIGSVTSQNTLTLAIRQYTRGIDYKDFVLTDGLYVIQTYLPETYEDFNQSKGRTARAGRKGRFNLILSSQDLKRLGHQKCDMSTLEAYWQQIERQIEQKREAKRNQALKKHRKTLSEYNANNLKPYIESINQNIKKEYFIIICFQGTLTDLRILAQKFFKILQSYQDCIRKLELKIRIKFQVCMFGNYSSLVQNNLSQNSQYQQGNNLIIKQSQISQNVEDLMKFLSTYTMPLRISKGDCVQALLRHIKRKGQKMQIDSVFLWNDKANYSWHDYAQTQYKRLKDGDRDRIKPYIIKQTCDYYLKKIAQLNIQMTFMAKGSERIYKQQIEKFSEYFGKSSLKSLYHLFKDEELRAIFYERIKTVIPQFDKRQAIQCLEI